MDRRRAAALTCGALAAVLTFLVASMLLFIREIGAVATACSPGSGAPEFTPVSVEASGERPGAGTPPSNFIPAYFAAANQPDAQLGDELGPFVLMGIHETESGFGRSDRPGVKSGINFANCCKGPFQFYDTAEWSTWTAKSRISGKAFARDGDGDGDVDIYSNYDSMFAAAAYLHHSGAPGDWNAALWSYNHSTAYRDQVLARARDFKRTVTRPESEAGQASVEVSDSSTRCAETDPAQILVPAAGGPYREPLPAGSFTVTSRFWTWRGTRGGYNHAGADLAAPTGTPIYAIGAGKVSQAGTVDGYGLYTCIDHTQTLNSCYAHQSRIDVEGGDTVKAGDKIGEVGNTGDSTGPHLHFEIRLEGAVQCPANWVGVAPAAWCEPGSPGFGAQVGTRA